MLFQHLNPIFDGMNAEGSASVEKWKNGHYTLALFSLLSVLKIVDHDSATEFITAFRLEDGKKNRLKFDKTITFTSNYRVIYQSFRKKFSFALAFVEGNHRAFALYLQYTNLFIRKDLRLLDLDDNFQCTGPKDHIFDNDLSIKVIFKPDNDLIDDWDIFRNFLKYVSNAYYIKKETFIKNSFCDSIKQCLQTYRNHNPLIAYQTLSDAFLNMTPANRNTVGDREFWFGLRNVMLKTMLQGGHLCF